MIGAAASSQGVTAAASNKYANMGLERWGVNPVCSTIWNVVTQANIDYLKSIRDAILARRAELKDSAPVATPRDEPDRVQKDEKIGWRTMGVQSYYSEPDFR